MKKYFSARGPLLELIFEMRGFTEDELLARYQKHEGAIPLLNEVITDYLDQLVAVGSLKKDGGRYIVVIDLED